MSITSENLDVTLPSWAEGWYIFEDGKISGPLGAKEVFSRQGQDDKPRMVSRKGFAQWYPIRDFARIHEMADQYALQLANIAKLDVERPAPKAAQPAKIIAKVLGPQETPIPMQQTMPAIDIPQNAPSLKHSKADLRKLMEQEHLLLRGRLRLGNVRSPFVQGFLLSIVTAMFYWGMWFSSTSQEVAWHLIGRTKLPKALPHWLAYVPGIHIYMTWKLAAMISGMERQNGYRATSPVTAAALSLVPPLAIYYLQAAINDHWRMHVRHSLANRSAL